MVKQTSGRRAQVLDVIRRHTESAMEGSGRNPAGMQAGVVSEMLGLDRANVSKELNVLYKTGQMIKLLGKPTLYLDRAIVSQQYPGRFFPTTIPKGKSLADYINGAGLDGTADAAPTASELEAQIGLDGSLQQAVLRAKAAVMYPPRGLHTLITGSVGSGRSRFARMMYDFAVENNYLPKDAPFLICNCREYGASPYLLLAQIFGQGRTAASEKSRRGLLERAAGGILCLEGIQRLSPIVQDQLITLLEKNVFTRVGEAAAIRYSDVILIAISSDPADSPSIEMLSRSIPMHISIPDLDDRGAGELFEYIAFFFQRESSSTGISFRVDREVLSCLLCAHYPGNISELASIIKTICSLAFLSYSSSDSKADAIDVLPQHLPQETFSHIRENAEASARARRLLSGLQRNVLVFSPGRLSPEARLLTDREEEERQDTPDAVRLASAPRIPVIAVLHGDGIAEKTADFINAVCGMQIVRGISYQSSMKMSSLVKAVSASAKELDNGKGVLIVSDMEPLGGLHEYVFAATGIQAETVTNINLPLLLTICQKILRCETSVHELVEKDSAAQSHPHQINVSFIDRIVNEILSTSLTFLNPVKAAKVLLDTLDKILTDLSLSYSDEISIKFIFHCSHMLERLIRGNSLKYEKLKSFTNEHDAVFVPVEKRMQYPAEMFGVPIPASEIAYIAEMFIPYVEQNVK